MDQLGNDHGLSIPAASGPSRRTVFKVAGALGVAGVLAQALPAGVARASTTPGFAGANVGAFDDMLSTGVPPTPPTGFRSYLDAVTYPNTTGYAGVDWPVAADNSPAHGLVSIRPDIEMLINGDFDATLYDFMQMAPPGPTSLLTMWHECATFSLSDPNYPQKPALFREGLVHLQQLAAGEISGYPSSNVKVGVVDINPTYLDNYPGYPNDPAAVYALWMAANMDWYGCDLYDNSSYTLSVYDELNAFQGYVNTLPGSVANANWPINLPECNSRVDTATGNSTITTTGPTGCRRSDFFHYAWAWLQNVGPGGHCSGLLGFWNGTGNEGSPWPPANTPAGSLQAMINELNAENAQSAP